MSQVVSRLASTTDLDDLVGVLLLQVDAAQVVMEDPGGQVKRGLVVWTDLQEGQPGRGEIVFQFRTK